jgi:hypothetical protein
LSSIGEASHSWPSAAEHALGERHERSRLTPRGRKPLPADVLEPVLRLVLHAEQPLELLGCVGVAGCDLADESNGIAMILGARAPSSDWQQAASAAATPGSTAHDAAAFFSWALLSAVVSATQRQPVVASIATASSRPFHCRAQAASAWRDAAKRSSTSAPLSASRTAA